MSFSNFGLSLKFLEEGWKIKGRNTFYLIKHLSNLYQIDVSFLSFNQHGFDVQWERTCYEFFHEPKKPIESTICKIYIHDFNLEYVLKRKVMTKSIISPEKCQLIPVLLSAQKLIFFKDGKWNLCTFILKWLLSLCSDKTQYKSE